MFTVLLGQCCFLLAAVTKLNVDRYPHHNTIPTVSNDSFRNTKKRATITKSVENPFKISIASI